MRTVYKLKGLFLMMLAFMMSSNVLAQEVITSTFKNSKLETEEGVKWEGTASGYDSQTKRGLQFTAGQYQLTLKNVTNVVSIEISYASTSSGVGTVSAFVGGTQIGDDFTISKGSSIGSTYNFESTSPLSGDIKLSLDITSKSCYIKQIIITTTASTGVYVPQPSFSKTEGAFTTPFDLTITADDNCTIKYTTDGSEPTTENGIEYTTPLPISATTTVKAIAIKDGVESAVTEATYTFIELEGNGSLEKPYTLNDIQYLNTGTEGWFTGIILGSYANGGNITTKPENSNWAIGSEDYTIPVQLKAGSLRDAVNIVDNSSFIGREVSFYGIKERYFDSDNGVKSTSQVYGLYELNITEAGYSTYYANHAFVVPTGIEVGIVTNASSAEATLTIDWSAYKEGEIVPANTGVILKGKEGVYPYIVDDSEAKAPANNLLKGSTTAATTEGENCLFYKLSYDNDGKNLGFYWAAENGAAFTNEANKAYLALTTAVAQNVRGFGLEGDGTTGIGQVENGEALVNVYTIDGIIVRKQVKESQALNDLKKGIYIVNGKKVIK